MTGTASKLNMYFMSMPRKLCANGVRLPASVQSFFGVIGTATKLTKSDSVTLKRKEMREQWGIAPATATRSIRALIDLGLLGKDGQSTFKLIGNEENGKQWYCPTELFTRTFQMKDDDGNVFERTLTPCTRLVYAYIYTKGGVYATYDEIADELGIDPSTVSNAMKYLRWAKLIRFPKYYVGKNRYVKSKIKLSYRWVWFKAEKKYRSRLKVSEQETEEREREEREAYYRKLQDKAEKRAEKARRRAERNIKYKEITEEITRVRAEYFKACDNLAKRAELGERLNILTVESVQILENLGLSEEMFDARYYVKCKACNDTGRTDTGTQCDCYDKRKRGSPPGKVKEGVGELNN